VLWIPTYLWFEFTSARLKAFELATAHLYRKSPPNKGIICGVFMHLMRSIESTPMNVPSHVRHSLAALKLRSTIATHGMMFLHDLNLNDDGSETLPQVLLEDDQQIRKELSFAAEKPRGRTRGSGQSLRTEEYPLGESPTWNQVKDTLKRSPLRLIRLWERPMWLEHTPTAAGILFVNFTKSVWVSIRTDWTERIEAELEAVTNLDAAMEFWSAEGILNRLKAVSFSINRSGIKGAVRGGQDAKSFRERTKIYFPDDDDILPPRGSKWVPFFAEVVGYIRTYHRRLRALSDVEDRERITEGLEDIFGHLQCLPNSEQFTSTKEGRVWGRAAGEEAIGVLVNASHLKFRAIGRTVQVKEGQRRTHVTRSNKEVLSELFKQHGLLEESEQLARRRWRVQRKRVMEKKSGISKNKRVPPKRVKRGRDETESEEEESSSSNESSS